MAVQAELELNFTFEAAHYLPAVPEGHKCGRVHGHSYSVDITVRGDVDPTTGFVIDFGDLRGQVEPLVKSLDHQLLNEVEGLQNPTSENLCWWFARELKDAVDGLVRVTVSETRRSRCTVTGPFDV